jgi:3-phosphoshikimate 1-carboxyvinyltransferase
MEERVRSLAGSADGNSPGDKSISHRAAMFNAIAEGEAVVENFLRGADCLALSCCAPRRRMALAR